MQVATLKTPKKKPIIWPWVLIGSLVLTIVAPVVLVYAFVYDDNTKKTQIQQDATYKDVGNRIIVDSLDNTVSKERIEVIVNDSDIDTILHLALDKVAKNNKFIKKAYVVVKGTTYNFYVDLDASIMKSRVLLSTTMAENDDKSGFIFTIKDISLGRISGIRGPMKKLVDRFVNEDTINNFIASAKLSMKYHKEDFTITYSKSDMIKDLSALTENKQLGLYFDVIETMIKDNLFEFDLKTNNFAEGYVDLKKLRTNECVTDSHLKVLPEQVTTNCKEKLTTLVNNNYINPAETDLQMVFDFLFGGYDSLTSEEKTKISAIDFSYVDIDDVTTYKGFDLIHNENKITDKMIATVQANKLIDKTLNPRYKEVCDLTEADINDYISGRNIVGYTSLLYRKVGEEYKINYLTIDNFYSNIYKTTIDEETINIAEFVCKININGYHTSLAFVTHLAETGFADNKLVFNIQDIKFGEGAAENLKQEFFNILVDALNGAGSDKALSVNKEAYTFTVDFSEIINYAKQKAEQAIEEKTGSHYDATPYFQGSNINFTTLGNTREEDGGFHLSLVNPIDY